jgi:hypothetical protein
MQPDAKSAAIPLSMEFNSARASVGDLEVQRGSPRFQEIAVDDLPSLKGRGEISNKSLLLPPLAKGNVNPDLAHPNILTKTG